MKVNILNTKGEVKSNTELFKGLKLNKSLLDQVLRVLEDSIHLGLNKVKTRSEVNRTKKKFYKQKGTGGARHGARSAHIFVGGGVVHGPTGVKSKLGSNKKMRSKALEMALFEKFSKGKAYLVDGLLDVKKTKEAQKVVDSLKLDGKLLVVFTKNDDSIKYFRNIKGLTTLVYSNLNAYEVNKSKNVILDSSIFVKDQPKKIETKSKRKVEK